MALRMRTWVGLVLLTCGALAVAALPPEAPQVIFGEVQRNATPERLRAAELREETFAVQEALRRRRWVDSLTALTRGAADRPERIVVGAPAVPEAERMRAELSAVAEDARAELVRLEINRPAVDLGVFLLSSSSGVTAPMVPPRLFRRVEWYAGEADGRGYCIAAHLEPEPYWGNVRAEGWTADLPGGSNILGPCGFYARHGVPGAAVQRWMQAAGASLAQARTPARIESMRREGTRYFRMRSSVEWGDVRIESCLKRSAESCGLLLTAREPRTGDDIDQIKGRLVAAGVPLLESNLDLDRTGGGAANWRMLADLERRFGEEAFGRFWRSTQPMTAAFQDAFGTTVEGWAFEWAQSLGDAESNLTVMPAASESGLMLLYTLMGLALAMRVAGRRRVG